MQSFDPEFEDLFQLITISLPFLCSPIQELRSGNVLTSLKRNQTKQSGWKGHVWTINVVAALFSSSAHYQSKTLFFHFPTKTLWLINPQPKKSEKTTATSKIEQKSLAIEVNPAAIVMDSAAPAKPNKLSTINVLTYQPISKNFHQMFLETSAPLSLETHDSNHISHIYEVQSPCRSLQIDNKYI